MAVNEPLNRKLRMGLIGGGQGAFIGRVHATAAVLDNRAVLVAGALSSSAEKSKASAPDYDIKPDRAYGSYGEMIAAEKKLPEGERVDFVSVATPNHTHFEIALTPCPDGWHVDYDLTDPYSAGGGPHYVIDPHTGDILARRYEQ